MYNRIIVSIWSLIRIFSLINRKQYISITMRHFNTYRNNYNECYLYDFKSEQRFIYNVFFVYVTLLLRHVWTDFDDSSLHTPGTSVVVPIKCEENIPPPKVENKHDFEVSLCSCKYVFFSQTVYYYITYTVLRGPVGERGPSRRHESISIIWISYTYIPLFIRVAVVPCYI